MQNCLLKRSGGLVLLCIQYNCGCVAETNIQKMSMVKNFTGLVWLCYGAALICSIRHVGRTD